MSELIITNVVNGKSFGFRGIDSLSDGVAQPVIAVPLVNTGPGSTFLFRFFGQSEIFSFTFALFSDGTDVGAGESIISIDDQIDYLKDSIFGNDFDTTWVIEDPAHRWMPTGGYQVVITNLNFSQKTGAGTVVMGSITLQRGKVRSI